MHLTLKITLTTVRTSRCTCERAVFAIMMCSSVYSLEKTDHQLEVYLLVFKFKQVFCTLLLKTIIY